MEHLQQVHYISVLQMRFQSAVKVYRALRQRILHRRRYFAACADHPKTSPQQARYFAAPRKHLIDILH
jgi:hypothetical protein